ncbi:MAG TPA: rhomboid family intramembrane serine protease, partial [Planctomycetota bacterium]|nr:rhomboid family intramembrane serine protease [Planctomycetota bacterium]
VIAAYAVFFPRHRVKMLLWMFFYVDVLFIPAVWWIGIWFAEQLLLSRFNAGGGVAYLAHIGGFLAGLSAAAIVRLLFGGRLSALPLPEGVRAASRSADGRRAFVSVEEDPGVVFVEDPADRYALLRLTDDLTAVARIAELVAEATGEAPASTVRRLEATRGMIARGLPRVQAERIQRALRPLGVPTAIVLDHPANAPAPPAPAEAVAWDETALRFRVGDGSVTVPWTAPFLYVGARVAGVELVDVFAGRRSAFRVTDRSALVEVVGRAERATDLDGFAAAAVRLRRGAALNEGIRVLAHHGAWGWLNFRSAQDYEDYLFWLYNLILSRVPLHRN